MKRNSGFTLVELAIVLVIIGLIIGGVLAGQQLIRNAEIQSVANEFSTLQAAMNTFRVRYNALPGDMRNATSIWGAADPDPTLCPDTDSGDKRTCNGNGDKRVWTLITGDDNEELLRIWQHLSNAELVNGTFSGVPRMPQGFEPSYNVPRSKISSAAAWFTVFMPNFTPAVQTDMGGAMDFLFYGQYGQVLILGDIVPVTAAGFDMPVGPVFSPSELRALDQKMDDGRPGLGMVKSWAPITGLDALGVPADNACATSTDPAIADYNADDDSARCAAAFRLKL